jgi:hypothetical protein
MARNATQDDELEDDGARLIVDEEMEELEASPPADDDTATDDDAESTESDDATEQTPEDGSAADDADDEQPDDDDGEAAEGDEPESDDDDDDAADEDDPAEPFEFKGDKATHTLEGAEYYPGKGIWMPETALPKLREQLAAAVRHTGSWQTEKAALESQIAEVQADASEQVKVAESVVELVFKDFDGMDEDQLYEWAVNFKRNQSALKAEVRGRMIDAREKKLTEREHAVNQPRPEEVEAERERYTGYVTEQITGVFDQVFLDPAMAVLTQGDKQKLLDRAKSNPLAHVRVADRDMPEFGIVKGETYISTAELKQWAMDRAEVRAEEASNRTVGEKVRTANKRKLGSGPKKKTPAPVVGSTATSEEDETELSYEQKRARWRDRMGIS